MDSPKLTKFAVALALSAVLPATAFADHRAHRARHASAVTHAPSCEDMTLMLTLAEVERSRPNGFKLWKSQMAEIERAQRRACAPRTRHERVSYHYYGNHVDHRYQSRVKRHPAHATVVWESGRVVSPRQGVLLYPSGQRARSIDGSWAFPSGRTVNPYRLAHLRVACGIDSPRVSYHDEDVRPTRVVRPRRVTISYRSY